MLDAERLTHIENKLISIDNKLDAAIRAEVSVGWLKWIVGGTWAAIAGMLWTK